MITFTNKFGTGTLLEEKDLLYHFVYIVSAACMSVTSDAESFLQYYDKIGPGVLPVKKRTVIKLNDICIPNEDNKIYIIILGCQVTDLAILNDIRIAEKLHKEFPYVKIAMGGCLAYRFDIELPNWCQRIGALRKEYVSFADEKELLVNWEEPFWTNTSGVDIFGRKTSSLFRNFYPLKVGAGCHGKCKYCTIRDTRGGYYETDANLQIKEFLDASQNSNYEGVVITSDSPSVKQIKDWCDIATQYEKPISFRNVEPHIALACKKELLSLALNGLLKIFHCPIQSNDKDILKIMNRDAEKTLEYVKMAQELRSFGVYVATNIIIDYVINEKVIRNMPTKWLDEHFDYWVWNPYFDGKWDRKKAEKRFKKYISVKE